MRRAVVSGHGRPRKRYLLPEIVFLAVIALVWFVPLDFIALTGRYKAIILGGSALLVSVGIWTASPTLLRSMLPRWLVFFLALQGIALVAGAPSLGYIALVLFVLGGILVGRGLGNSLRIATWAAVAGWLVAMEQWLTHSYGYITAFGSPLLPIESFGGYRTRGTLGEPLAVAAVYGSLLTLACVRAWLDRVRPAWESAIFMLMVVTLALATGSRTALLVPPLAVAGCSVVLAKHPARRSLRVLASSTLYGVTAVGVCLLIFVPSVLGTLGGTTRAFAFSGISQTQSYTNRSNALGDIVNDVADGSIPRLVLGRGDRALQRYLENGDVLGGFDTGDDQYLTFAYDFGLVGVGALAMCWFVAIRGLRRARSADEAAAAVGLVCWLVFGFFLDNLYLFAGDVVAGLMIGWTLGVPTVRAKTVEPVEQDATWPPTLTPV